MRILLFLFALAAEPILAQAPRSSSLVEEFTATTLPQYTWKLGTDSDWGMSREMMLGTDVIASAIGFINVQAKYHLLARGSHAFALGLRGVYANRNTVLAGATKKDVDELSVRFLRPSVSWSRALSERFFLHTFWALGMGKIHLKLSERGQRELWESKYPTQPFPADASDETTNTPKNQARGEDESRLGSATQRSFQMQSFAGLAQDRFQITGEIVRASGDKILLTSRVERLSIEQLESMSARFSAAHQWVGASVNLRLGGGFEYLDLSGTDLDGEHLSVHRWSPVTEVVFYWIL